MGSILKKQRYMLPGSWLELNEIKHQDGQSV